MSCSESGKKQSQSKTVILVKNLPFGNTADELAQLFSAFGGLDHVILSPAGVTAIVKGRVTWIFLIYKFYINR